MTFSGLPNPQPSEVHREIGNSRGAEAARNAEQARALHEDRPSLLARLEAVVTRRFARGPGSARVSGEGE